MAYELIVRPGSEGAAETPAEDLAERLAGALGASAEGETFIFEQGGTKITLRPSRGDGGEVVGAELVLPYGAVRDEVEAGLKRVLGEIAARGWAVFDPQLGSEIGRGDLDRVLARFSADSAYHVELAGVVEDPRQGLAAAADATPARKTSLQVKILGGLIALLVLVWLVFQGCVVQPMLRQIQGEEGTKIEDEGPTARWLATHPPDPDAPPVKGPLPMAPPVTSDDE